MSLFAVDQGATGMFRHQNGNYFEFRPTTFEWALEQGMTHEVSVTTPRIGIDQGYRYARVLKTVCHIWLDEDQSEDTNIIESWPIKMCWRNEV